MYYTVGMERISVEFGQLSKDDRVAQKEKKEKIQGNKSFVIHDWNTGEFGTVEDFFQRANNIRSRKPSKLEYRNQESNKESAMTDLVGFKNLKRLLKHLSITFLGSL